MRPLTAADADGSLLEPFSVDEAREIFSPVPGLSPVSPVPGLPIPQGAGPRKLHRPTLNTTIRVEAEADRPLPERRIK